MGTLADIGAADVHSEPGRVDRVLARLNDDDRATLLEWLSDLSVGANTISRRLRMLAAQIDDPGVTIADTTVARWRQEQAA